MSEDPTASVRRVALDLAAELLERLRAPEIRELEVRQGSVRVKVSKGDGAVAPDPPSAAPAEASHSAGAERDARAASAAPARAAPAGKEITAPLTGIFYRSSSPQIPPFVQAGTVVNPGDVVGLIEAMKLFNEVRSPVGGRVRRIIAENGQLVRAHQPLVELE